MTTSADPLQAPTLDTSTPVVEPPADELAHLGVPPAGTGGSLPAPPQDPMEAIRKAVRESAPITPQSVDPIAAGIAAEQRGAAPSPAPPQDSQTPAADPIAAAIADDQKREDALQAQLLQWRAANDKTDPTRRADVLRYSAASGFAPDFVDKNLDQVRSQLDAKGVNWAWVIARQPALAKFMLEAPSITPLVKDDVANLSGLEWLVKAPYHAFVDAIGEQEVRYHQFLEAEGLGNALYGDNQRIIRELEAQYSNRDYGARNWLTRGLIGGVSSIPFFALDIAARGAGGMLGAGIAGETGAEAGALAGAPAEGVGAVPGAAIGATAGGLTGAAVGQYVGSGLFNYAESLGENYWRLSQLRDSSGKPLDPDLVEAVAQSGAMVNGALFAFGGKMMESALPGVKPLFERVGANAVEKALASTTVRDAVLGGMRTYGTGLTHGVLTMTAQGAVNAAAEELAKEYQRGLGPTSFEGSWGRVADAAGASFKNSLEDMWLLTAIGPGRELLRDVGNARRTAEGAAKLEAMTDSARSSKLLERFPQGFQEAVRRMKAAKGAVQNVSIPVEEWTSYWQAQKSDGKPMDPGQVAAEVVGDGGKAYADALATKSDLVIPVERYLTKLAPTEHAAGLAPDTRYYQDTLTPREQQAENERQAARMQQDEATRGAELDQGRSDVYDLIRAQAEGAGIPKADADANAQLIADFSRAMALRMGVSVQEAAALGALGKLRILGPKGEQAAAGARAALQRFLSPEASQILADRLSSMDPEARAREYYLDPVSGLRNARAFDETPVPEGKSVAVLTSPSIKGINDHPTAGGHDVANDALRAMGLSLSELAPEAARGGTNFRFLVDPDKAEEQLQAAIAKVKGSLPAGMDVIGATGKDSTEAFKNLRERTDAARAKAPTEEGHIPPRAALRPELDVSKLSFPEGRAKAEVPQHLVEKVRAQSDREYFDKTYLDHVYVTEDGKRVPVKTGLLTREGFYATPDKPYTLAFDLKGLGKVPQEVGDQMLLAFARAASHMGGSSFDAAHLSGDEFAAKHSDPEALEAYATRIREHLKDVEIRYENPATGKLEVARVDFRHGIGSDYANADRDLNARRRAEEGGLGGGAPAEAGSGAVPPRADGAPPGEGDQVPGDQLQGQESLGRGGAAGDGRGARPQAFPDRGEQGQVVAHVEGTPVTFEARPPGADGPRGEIRLQLEPSGRPVAFDIRVLAGDRSTFLHETGHFLSWSLHEIATSDLATSDIRKDYQALLEWAGYDSPEERVKLTREKADLEKKVADGTATDDERSRVRALAAKEERISHGWEQYMLEGKTPSEGLESVFSRFKGWLKRIYDGVAGIQAQYREKYGEEIQLSDEVRGVFDRMLATDEAIQQAQADIGFGHTQDALEGLSPEEREAHRQAVVAARQKAETEVARRAAEIDEQRVGEERARIEGDVTKQVDSEPVYRAMRFLQLGELADGEGGVKSGKELPSHLVDDKGRPLKLNRGAFVEKYGADVAREMPAGIFDRTKKGGVSADEAALKLGFDSGEDLVKQFRQAEDRDKLIQKRTQERLDATYGPALKLMADAAMAAVHSDAAAHAILLENRSFARRVNPAAARRVENTDLDTVKETAQRIVGETAVGELNPDRYARAERKAAMKAAELWGRGEKEKALEYREARLLNHVLYRAARDAKEALEKAWEKFHGTSEEFRASLGKADPSYRDVHDALLEAVGISPPAPDSGVRLGLDAALERARLDAQEMPFDQEGIRRLLARPKPWESLTADEAQNVADALTNIRTAARFRNNVILEGKQQAREEFIADVAEHFGRRKSLPKQPLSRTAETKVAKAFKLGRGADALLSDIETLAHLMDAGDRDGPMHRLLVDARNACRAKEAELAKSVLSKISEAWTNVPKEIRKLQGQKMDLADLLPAPPGSERLIAPIHTRDSLWMLFLNWAHEDGRQRIRDGMGWSDANVEKALSLLSEPELDYLQGVLNSIESLYPELARVYEGRTGLKLGKVKAAPMIINGKEYAGGYWVLKYDSRLSKPGEMSAEDVIASLFQPNYIRPITPTGHTKARVAKVNAPVDLSWGVVPAHFAQVIHDIAYGDWVRQAGSIFLDRRFKELVDEYFGEERRKQLIPWLRDVANARADSAAANTSDFLKKTGQFTRSRVGAAVLAYNAPLLLQQLTDPWNAHLDGLGWQHIASAYLKVTSPVADLPELAKSKEIAVRDATYLRNLREVLGEAGSPGKGVMHEVTETGMKLYEILDRLNARILFKAGYDKAIGEGFSEEEAIRAGDDQVRRRLVSFDVGEKAPILRTKSGLAGVLMFHSYASKQFNSLRRLADDAYLGFTDESATTGSRAAIVATVAAKLLAYGAVGVVGAYLAGRGPKPGDDSKKWLAERVLLEPFNTVPFAGPILESVVNGQKINVRSAPELAALEETLNHIGDLMNEKKAGEDRALAAVEALLLVAGGPVGQVQRTASGVLSMVNGQQTLSGPVSGAGSLIYGERKDQPRNALSDIQRAIKESWGR